MRWGLFLGLLCYGVYESTGRVVVVNKPKVSSWPPNKQDDSNFDSSRSLRAALEAASATLTGRQQPATSFALNPASDATARLIEALTSLQHPAACSTQLRATGDTEALHDCGRFLVFTYGPEQGINGFGAMFQWYAAALLLAHRYNRTLIELHPPPLPTADAGAGWRDRPHELLGGKAFTALATARSAAATMSRAAWAAAAALSGSASDAGIPDDPRLPAAARLFARLARANDPWKRTPLAACGGAKAGCLFRAPASFGLTILPPEVAAALPVRHGTPLNETALYALAQRLLGGTFPAAASAAAASDEADAAAAAIPLLDVAAEERRLFRLTRGRDRHSMRSQGERGGDGGPEGTSRTASGRNSETASSASHDGYDPSGRSTREIAGQGQDDDPADARVVRVDTIARYRDIVLALSAGLEPAQAAALEQLHAIAANAATAAAPAQSASAAAAMRSAPADSAVQGGNDGLDTADDEPAYHASRYLSNAQAFADAVNASCARMATCIAVLLSGPATGAAASTSRDAWLCCGGSTGAGGGGGGGAASTADTARLRQLQLRYSLHCALPRDNDVTWPQRRQSFIESYISSAWSSHQHGEQLRIARRRKQLRLASSAAAAASGIAPSPLGDGSMQGGIDASDPLLKARDLVVPQSVQLQRSDDVQLRRVVAALEKRHAVYASGHYVNAAAPLGRCDVTLQSWVHSRSIGQPEKPSSSPLRDVLTAAAAAASGADNSGLATGWQRLWFPAHQAFLFRPRPSVAQLAPFNRRMALSDSSYDSGALLLPSSSSSDSSTAPGSGHRHDDAADAGDGLLSADASIVTATNAPPTMPGAAVGIHFRQGDALVVGWRSKAPLTEYAEQAVRAAAAMHGVAQARPLLQRPDRVWMDVPAAAMDTDNLEKVAGQAGPRGATLPSATPAWNWSLALASDSARARSELPAAVALGHLELHFQDLFRPSSSSGGAGGGSIFGGTTATARWQAPEAGSEAHVAALRRALMLPAGEAAEATPAAAAAFLDRGPFTKPAALLTSGAPILTVAGGGAGVVQPTGAARQMESNSSRPAAGGTAASPAADAFVHTESWIEATLEAAAAAADTVSSPSCEDGGESCSAPRAGSFSETALDAAGNAEAASSRAPAVTTQDVTRRAYDLASRTDPRVKAMPQPDVADSTRTRNSLASVAGRQKAALAPTPGFLASLRSYLRYIAESTQLVKLSADELTSGEGSAPGPQTGQPRPSLPQLRLFRVNDDTFPIAAEAHAAAAAALRRTEAALASATSSGVSAQMTLELQSAAAILRQHMGLGRSANTGLETAAPGEDSAQWSMSPSAVAAVLQSAPAAAAAAVHAVSAGVVADIDILADSAALVGTGLSQVSRTAYDLSAARGAALLPPVALDADSLRTLPLPHPYAILSPWRATVVSSDAN